MLSTDTTLLNHFKDYRRKFKVRVGSTSYIPIYSTGDLVSFTIERTVPSGKFFGFTVMQKLTVECLGDKTNFQGRLLPVWIEISSSNPSQSSLTLPEFTVEKAEYSAVKNTTILTAYDEMKTFESYTYSSLLNSITFPITISELATKICSLSGYKCEADFGDLDITLSEDTLNLEGGETRREVLTAIAEATGTICYCTTNRTIVFKTLSQGITADDTLPSSAYFDLTTQDGVTLTEIASTNDLGDNISVGSSGHTQAIYDNPFLVLRDDIGTILEGIAAKVLGITIIPHTLDWRGNAAYEVGDLIAVEGVDGETYYLHQLSSTLTYNGGLKATNDWEATESEKIESTPTTVGEALSQTYAKVDKANKQIELVVKQSDETSEKVNSFEVTVDGILTSVNETKDLVNEMGDYVAEINNKVETSITPEEMEIAISTAINANTPNEVTTTTGFTFNSEGLTVSKDTSELATTITEDGLKIKRSNETVLTVNNVGVEAKNLHATTYLMIGETSRFEDYNNKTRTGCFWIGEVN